MKAQRTQRDSFLVRIWREGSQKDWRGWVQHTHSGESTPIRDLGELHAFLERWTGKLDEPARKGLK